MKLVHAPEYSIRVITPSTSDVVPQSEIVVAGVPTGRVLSGAVFEAALRWNEYVLLFLTDDVPFEDGLNIYLLDENLSPVDSAEMHFIYSTGIFSDLDLTQPDTVHFRFFGGMVWTVRLHAEKKFALPIMSNPKGVNRPFAFFRMFEIDSRPLPDTSQAENRRAESS